MAQQSPRRLELTVTADQAGEKIDTLLRRELRLSGTVIRRVKWLDDGILLDGMRVTTACRPAAGQVLSVRVADTDGQGDMVPTPGPLDIVYEDGDLLVLNKAPGVLVHPGPGHYSDTLCNYIAWYYKKAGISADVHPVQRLDKGASGLLVVARRPHAQEQLKGQLHTPTFRRIYLAVCEGIPRPPEGRIDAPIGRVPGSLMARQVDPAGQPASTRYRVLRTGQGRALVELELDTGRTHRNPGAHGPHRPPPHRRLPLRHGGSQPHLPPRPPLRPALPPPPRHRGTHGLGAASAGGHGPAGMNGRLSRTRESRPFIYTPVKSKAGMYSDCAASAPWVKPSSPRASI